jgi:hypothetical protein
MKAYTISVIVLLLVAGVIYGYMKNERATPGDKGVLCTMDAMQCPDGSYVGRRPPRCEFAPCPDAGSSTGGSGSGTHASVTIDFEGNVQ